MAVGRGEEGHGDEEGVRLETKNNRRLPKARSFRDLVVYQKARRFALDIFEASKRFPKDEVYSLTSQIRRSSRSVGAQIAEAWAKRLYERHFISKLTDADAELQETRHWIDVACDCGYWPEDEAKVLVDEVKEIGNMLGSMIAKAHLFRRTDIQGVKETAASYDMEIENSYFCENKDD